MLHQVVVAGWSTITIPLVAPVGAENYSSYARWLQSFTGVHQLDAAGQEVGKPPAGKLPYCLRSGADQTSYDAQ